MRADILVCYDVNTLESEGRARLRRVAKVCKSYGQRVQYSVFECSVSDMNMEKLKSRLLKIIEPKEDSLRVYHLHGGREKSVECYGLDKYVDYDEPMVV